MSALTVDPKDTPSTEYLDAIMASDGLLELNEVIRAYCALSEVVHHTVIHGDHPSDCFCGYGGFQKGDGTLQYKTVKDGYRNDGAALRFIIQAVRNAIAIKKPAQDALREQIEQHEAKAEELRAKLNADTYPA